MKDLLGSQMEILQEGRLADESNVDKEVQDSEEQGHLAALSHIYMNEFKTVGRQLEFILADS